MAVGNGKRTHRKTRDGEQLGMGQGDARVTCERTLAPCELQSIYIERIDVVAVHSAVKPSQRHHGSICRIIDDSDAGEDVDHCLTLEIDGDPNVKSRHQGRRDVIYVGLRQNQSGGSSTAFKISNRGVGVGLDKPVPFCSLKLNRRRRKKRRCVCSVGGCVHSTLWIAKGFERRTGYQADK